MPARSAARWHAGSGATWDLRSNALRPAGWTSADAAGLPILPGLVRYDEVAAGADRPRPPVHDRPDAHGVHLPGDATRPASRASPSLPPMGLRVRLKAIVRHQPVLAAGAGHRGRAQALRDDPRRQRIALVRHRRQRPALRRRRHARARRRHRPRPRGRRHDRAGQRPVARRGVTPARRTPSTGDRHHGGMTDQLAPRPSPASSTSATGSVPARPCTARSSGSARRSRPSWSPGPASTG